MKGPDRVSTALHEAGLDIDVVWLEKSARTAQLAAEALGVPLGAIVKSLVFLADGKPILVLVAGDRRADPAKLKQALGARRVMIADAEQVRQATGYAIGGVPPIGHSQVLATWIDGSLGRFDTVYAAAGHPRAVFPIDPQALARITRGKLGDVTE